MSEDTFNTALGLLTSALLLAALILLLTFGS